MVVSSADQRLNCLDHTLYCLLWYKFVVKPLTVVRPSPGKHKAPRTAGVKLTANGNKSNTIIFKRSIGPALPEIAIVALAMSEEGPAGLVGGMGALRNCIEAGFVMGRRRIAGTTGRRNQKLGTQSNIIDYNHHVMAIMR